MTIGDLALTRHPKLSCPLHCDTPLIRFEKGPSLRRSAIFPGIPTARLKDHRHSVMNFCNRPVGLGHNHRIDFAPFNAIPPYSCDSENRLIGQRKPCPGFGTLLALRFGELRYRYKTPPLRKTVPPHEPIELIRAGIVNRLGLERLAFRSLQDERKTPHHHAQRLSSNHETRISRIDFDRKIGRRHSLRLEHSRNLGLRSCHTVEIAHRVARVTFSRRGQQRARPQRTL